MPNPFSTGVKRLVTLGGLGTAPDPETVNELKAAGYDSGSIDTAVALGATNEQLQALPYPADPATILAATQQLLNQLAGALPASGQPASSAASYPKGAIPVIDTSFGQLDLSVRSTWDYVTGLFSQVASGLNAVAAQRPNDPIVIQYRSQYNSLASQFSSAWATVFSSSSPIQTLGTWQDIAVGTGIVILGGVAIASGVGIPLVATLGTILAGLWVILQWINSQSAQTQVAQTQASNVGTLTNTYQDQATAANKAYAAGNKALGDQLMAQANATLAAIQKLNATQPGNPMNWSAWFQQNTGTVLFAIAVIAITPPLIRKL